MQDSFNDPDSSRLRVTVGTSAASADVTIETFASTSLHTVTDQSPLTIPFDFFISRW